MKFYPSKRSSIAIGLGCIGLLSACGAIGQPVIGTEKAPDAQTAAEHGVAEATSAANAESRGVDGPDRANGQPRVGLDAKELAWARSDAMRRDVVGALIPETEIEPPASDEEREQLARLGQLIRDNKLEEAAGLAAGLTKVTASAQLDFTEGFIHYQLEDGARAKAALREAVGKHPKFLRAWKLLGSLYYQDSELQQAIEAFSQVVRYGGNSGEVFGLLGACQAKLENFVPAETAFREAVMLDPNNKVWKSALAETLLRQGNFPAAASMLEPLLAATPGQAELWRMQGMAYARMGETMKAVENFEMVDSLGQASGQLLNNLGSLYAQAELYDSAADAYVRALAKTKGAPVAAIAAAKFLSQTPSKDAALRLVDAIGELPAESFKADDQAELLRIQARLSDGDEMLSVLKKVVELDPSDGHAMLQLGSHARRANQLDQAKMWFERAREIEKHEADARVSLAQVLVKEQKYPEAVRELEAAQKIKDREVVADYLKKVKRAMTRR